MAVALSDPATPVGLKELDALLLSRSYITGYQASRDDLAVYAALPIAPGPSTPHAARWYNHITALLGAHFPGQAVGVVISTGAPPSTAAPAEVVPARVAPADNVADVAVLPPPPAAVPAPAPAAPITTPAVELAPSEAIPAPLSVPAKDATAAEVESAPAAAAAEEDDDDDDDLDLFGDETEEEKKAREAREAAVQKSAKKKESGKSSVLLDIKPWDDETDMAALEASVRAVVMDGLTWGASKLLPVAFGVKKLSIMMTIVDDKVGLDDLIEDRLTAEGSDCAEYIQSCDIVAFNKI